jgi:hypothetical protein
MYSGPSPHILSRRLNRELLEMQGEWDAAPMEYQAVLQQNPSLPGIHFRLDDCCSPGVMPDRPLTMPRKNFSRSSRSIPTMPVQNMCSASSPGRPKTGMMRPSILRALRSLTPRSETHFSAWVQRSYPVAVARQLQHLARCHGHQFQPG